VSKQKNTDKRGEKIMRIKKMQMSLLDTYSDTCLAGEENKSEFSFAYEKDGSAEPGLALL